MWFYDVQTDDYFSNIESFVNAYRDFEEDAYDNIFDEDKGELQNMLDKWCNKRIGTRTVYPNYKKYVRVRKEWFNEGTKDRTKIY